MTGVGFVASLIGVYGDGELRFDRVYLYTTIVSNISQVDQTFESHCNLPQPWGPVQPPHKYSACPACLPACMHCRQHAQPARAIEHPPVRAYSQLAMYVTSGFKGGTEPLGI